MNDQRPISKQSFWCFLFFLISTLVPWLHFQFVDGSLERTRYSWGLMPAEFLFLRWFGQLAVVVSVSLLILFFLSWRHERLRSPSALLCVSLGLYMFMSLYAAYFCLIVRELLNWQVMKSF